MSSYILAKADREEFAALAAGEVTTLLRTIQEYITYLERENERLRAAELEWTQHGPHLRPMPHISGTQ